MSTEIIENTFQVDKEVHESVLYANRMDQAYRSQFSDKTVRKTNNIHSCKKFINFKANLVQSSNSSFNHQIFK